MKIRFFLPSVLVCSLSACATSVFSPESSPALLPSATVSAAEAENTYPRQVLTNEILFGVLASEIAAQRGGAAAAAPTTLSLARLTGDPRLARRAAEFALSAGRTDEAITALTLWRKAAPTDRYAEQQLALALLRAGRMPEAVVLLESQLATRPQEASSVFLLLAGVAGKQANKAASYRMLQGLASGYADVPEARFALAVAAAEAGNLEAAERYIETAANLAPRWDVPVVWWVERLRQTRPEAALAFLQSQLAKRPHASLELKLTYPRLLVMLKQYAAAREAFAVLKPLAPQHPEILYGLGVLAFELKDYDIAQQELEAALSAGYRDADFVRFILGQVAEARQRPDEAQTWYSQVGQGAQYVPAQGRLAALEAKAGGLEAGLARLAALTTLKEVNRVPLLLAQVQLAKEQGNKQRARALLNQGLKTYPSTPEWRYERGLLNDDLGDTEAAIADLRLSLKLQPNTPQGLNALGYVLANHNRQLPEARRLVSRALKLEPNNPMLLDSMGWVEFRLGQFNAALGYLQRAYQLLPDAEIAAHLGEVLWVLGRQAEALVVWDKAIEAGDASGLVRRTQTRLQPAVQP